MKLILMCTALALTGCVLGGPPGPTALPNNADAGIWSIKDQATVSQCLTTNALSSAYEAFAIDSKKTSYRTVIIPAPNTPANQDISPVLRCV